MKTYTQKVKAIQFNGTMDSVKKIIEEFEITDDVLILPSNADLPTETDIEKIILNCIPVCDSNSTSRYKGKSVDKYDFVVKDTADSIKVYDESYFKQIFK